MRRRSSPLLRALLAALAAATIMAPVACSSEDDDGDDGAAPTTSDHHGDGADADGYGSSMAPDIVGVDDVAALGPGPGVGDTWSGHLGLNVCGRFLDPPVAAGPAAGFTTDGTGAFSVAPTDRSDAGAAATIGDLAALVGIDVSTGTMTLPASTTPAEVELDGGPVPTAGATFSTGQACGSTPATVQLWIYTEAAAASGEDVLVVVTDPEDVPTAQDGMTFVLSLSPASSLPTLPPSALGT